MTRHLSWQQKSRGLTVQNQTEGGFIVICRVPTQNVRKMAELGAKGTAAQSCVLLLC